LVLEGKDQAAVAAVNANSVVEKSSIAFRA